MVDFSVECCRMIENILEIITVLKKCSIFCLFRA